MVDLLSSNAYVNDILGQPEALRNTLAAFEGFAPAQVNQLSARIRDHSIKRIVLTGMGSSYHALNPLQITLIDRGLPVQMIETAELIHFAPKLLSTETLVVAVSQSGRSAEINHLLDLASDVVPLIGITNTLESPLGQNTWLSLVTRAGEEHSVSCKTYIAALATLAVLGDMLSDIDPGYTISVLSACADTISQYLSNWQSLVQYTMRRFEGIKALFLAGRGASLAAARTGGLIIKEAARFPAEGMSCAAFRHGPFEMVSPEVFVLVFQGLGSVQYLNKKLVADILQAGGVSELVSMDGISDPFKLPVVPEKCLPLLEILPAQIISLALAVLKDHSPGQFIRAAKVTDIE